MGDSLRRFEIMPTIFSHAILSAAMGAAYADRPMPARFWTLAGLCSVLPDLDVIAFWLGIPYRSVWGHRGFTHSLLFAVLAGCLIALWGFRGEELADMNRSRRSLAVFFSLAITSHLMFDSLTNGGLGVAAFAPFDNARYFAPFRPIRVSPIGADFFSSYGLQVLASEIVWVWIPALALVLLARLYRRTIRAGKTI